MLPPFNVFFALGTTIFILLVLFIIDYSNRDNMSTNVIMANVAFGIFALMSTAAGVYLYKKHIRSITEPTPIHRTDSQRTLNANNITVIA